MVQSQMTGPRSSLLQRREHKRSSNTESCGNTHVSSYDPEINTSPDRCSEVT